MKITTLTNGNLYLNGSNRAGTIDTIKLPDLKQKTQDVMPLGAIGTVQVPSGFEAMEMTMSISAYDEAIMSDLYDPYKTQQIQVRGEVMEHSANGTTVSKQYTFLATGKCIGVTEGEFKAHELVKKEITFTIMSITVKYDNVEQLVINLLTGVHRIKGVDIKGNYRNQLGLA